MRHWWWQSDFTNALLDLSVAFDTIDRTSLLKRLKISFGFDGVHVVLDWIWSYLSDRKQKHIPAHSLWYKWLEIRLGLAVWKAHLALLKLWQLCQKKTHTFYSISKWVNYILPSPLGSLSNAGQPVLTNKVIALSDRCIERKWCVFFYQTPNMYW